MNQRNRTASGRSFSAVAVAALTVFALTAAAMTVGPAAWASLSDRPASRVLSPVAGARVAPGTPVTVTGQAVNGEAGGILRVEISLDGGATWNPTDYGSERWSYTFTPDGPGQLLIVSRASTADVTESPHEAVTVVAVPPDEFDAHGCPCTLWTGDRQPDADPDDQPVELGVRFRVDVAGLVTGVRFATFTADAEAGRLWTEDGQLLAQGTATGPAVDGWQAVSFDPPVPVQTGVTYVASYYAPTGHYASTEGLFTSGDFLSRPLRTVQQPYRPGEPPAGAGVYRYGEGGGFPDQTWHDSGYWVTPVVTAP